jgi:hypothetical protein
MVGYDAAVKLNHLKVKGRLVSERTKVANQKASGRRRLRMSLLWKVVVVVVGYPLTEVVSC